MEIHALLQALDAPLPPEDRTYLNRQLEQHVRHLIDHDFERLLQLLYTVDVPEERLKAVLQQQPRQDTAAVIAALILERQQQKANSRLQFRMEAPDEEERWE